MRSEDAVSSEAGISAFEAQAAVLRDLQLHIDHKIADLAKVRNSLVPINRLPVELASEVLARVVPGIVSMRRLRKLAGVQTRWRDIILSHVSFWCNIDVRDPLKVVDLKLRRSGNAPLTISQYGGGDEDPDHPAF